jgi:hypothetical protein
VGPTTEAEVDRDLTAIAVVMEEEHDQSQLKLVDPVLASQQQGRRERERPQRWPESSLR